MAGAVAAGVNTVGSPSGHLMSMPAQRRRRATSGEEYTRPSTDRRCGSMPSRCGRELVGGGPTEPDLGVGGLPRGRCRRAVHQPQRKTRRSDQRVPLDHRSHHQRECGSPPGSVRCCSRMPSTIRNVVTLQLKRSSLPSGLLGSFPMSLGTVKGTCSRVLTTSRRRKGGKNHPRHALHC